MRVQAVIGATFVALVAGARLPRRYADAFYCLSFGFFFHRWSYKIHGSWIACIHILYALYHNFSVQTTRLALLGNYSDMCFTESFDILSQLMACH